MLLDERSVNIMNLKKICFENKMLYSIISALRKFKSRTYRSCIIKSKGRARIRKDFSGEGNIIEIGLNSSLYDTSIRIRGNNNRLLIGENVFIGPECSFWMEGNNTSICIGDNSTFTKKVHFCVQENGSSIRVGNDCMFANTITIRTSDSHPVLDMETGERLNPAKNVIIEDHVWVAPNVHIMKGAVIHTGAIIGTDTIVTKNVEANSLAVGHPAKEVKRGITWSRESVF